MASTGENMTSAPQPISGVVNMLDDLQQRTITLQKLAQELGDKLHTVLYPGAASPEGTLAKKQECPMMEIIQLTLDETNATIGYLRSLSDRLAL